MADITFSIFETLKNGVDCSILGDPFFRPVETEVKAVIHISENNLFTGLLEMFRDTALERLYSELTSNTQQMTYGIWTLMSLHDIEKGLYQYNNKFIDIGIAYMGMGHVAILAYIPSKNTFFCRADGGANGYEREFAYNKYINDLYQPSKFDMYRYDENNKISTVFELVNNDYQYRLNDILKVAMNVHN